jgi:Carboxypeptidase regulatory-like domain/PDZ domain
VSSNRLSGLNVVLLAVTLLALLFGAYGYIRPHTAPESLARHNVTDAHDTDRESNSAVCEPVDKPSRARREESPKPTSSPSDAPKNEARPDRPVVAKSDGPLDTGDAGLNGVVLNSGGSPVARATVSARRSNFNLQQPVVDHRDPASSREALARYLEQVQSQTRTTTSDANGKFSFAGLDSRLSYDLFALSEEAGRAQRERVAAGDTVTLILQPMTWLMGRVLGPDGSAVTQFSVKVYRRNRQWEGRTQAFVASDGRFRMECGTGLSMVEIEAPGFTQGGAAEVNVEESGNEHEFRLSQAALLSGIVRDKQGNPMPNVRVTTGPVKENWDRRGFNNEGNANIETRTDSQGRYRFETLSPKEHTFSAVCGDSFESKTLTLKVGENAQDFSVDAGVRVILRLKDMRGKPVDVEQVWFLRKGNEWLQGERLPAKEAGVAEFIGLRADDYTLSVTASGYPTLRRSLKLTGAQQIVELELPDGAMLGGKITSTSGAPLLGITIRLVKDGESENEAWGSGRWTQIQSDGSYRIGPIEPGLWSIDVMGQDWKKVSSEKRNLIVGENKFDFSLNTGGTLSVRVSDESGKSPGWAYVTLRSASGKSYEAQANQQGVATLNFVEPGEYTMHVSTQGLAAPASQVNVRDGQNDVSVTVRKPNCARITSVGPESQGAKIGLQPGDLIVEYNGEKVNSWEDVGRLRRKYTQADDVTITLDRNGQILTLNLKGGQIGIDGESAIR